MVEISMNRYQKYVDLALALAALAVWYLLRQMLFQVWELFRLPQWEGLPIQTPGFIALAAAAGAFITVRTNRKAMTFLNEVAMELSKVTWPNRKETVASTGVIIVMVGIASVIMFLFDTVWGTLTRSFLTL